MVVLASFVGMINLTTENAQAGTAKSGTISVDETWDLAGSPYWIEGDVTVENWVTLTIDPGVEVKFNGYYALYVDGILYSTGTSGNAIDITSNQTIPTPGYWNRIQINSSGQTEIRYTNISYSDFGPMLYSSSNNNITNSNISSNRFESLVIYMSPNNNIVNNSFSDNGEGIAIYASPNINITDNKFFNDGIYITGDDISHYDSHTIPPNNEVNGKPLYYHKNCNGIDINGISVGQLFLVNCANVNVSDIQINNTAVGIEVAYSTNIDINNNSITNNNIGILLAVSSGNYITNNNVSSNIDLGIELQGSPRNNITDNNVSTNGETGIYLYMSSNVVISTNNLTQNNVYGIGLGWISNNTFIAFNNITSNQGGGLYIGSSYNNITNNNISSNERDGLSLYGDHNDISSNLISKNEMNGTYLRANFNILVNNTVISNTNHGIYIASFNPFSDNQIYHNSFIDNNNSIFPQAYDGSINGNFWNDTYPSGGNYWSDHSPTCQDMYNGAVSPQTSGSPDGICDVQYAIDANSADFLPLTQPWGAGPDITGPAITNLQPPDSSATSDDTPIIGADYYDLSGIDVSSVLLLVDGNDVTSAATVTTSGVTYTPSVPLANVQHDVDLEVNDTSGNQATTSWSFIVDTTLDTAPPTIANLQPANGTTTSDSTPIINADFSDDTGINVNSVVLKVDGTDVTSSATITSSGIAYTPSSALSDGVHTIYIEVKDNSTNQNEANVSWSFTVETSGTEPDPTPKGDFLSEYWWLILLIVIAILVLLVLFMMIRKKRKPIESAPSKELADSQPEESGEEDDG
jgi:parallel beta-helix repeat protein